MNKDNKTLKEKELEEVNGGVIPFIAADSGKAPEAVSASVKPELQKIESDNNTFVPI